MADSVSRDQRQHSAAPALAAARLRRQPKLWQLGEKAELLGEGGCGRVYRGTYKGRPAAIKEIMEKPWQVGNFVQRELASAKQLLKLQHRNIVQYYDIDHAQSDRLYIVMEIVDGHDLTTLRKRDGPLSLSVIRQLVLQVCHGLHYLHTRSPIILHRDLKGANIMVTQEQLVKLVDFGLAIACSRDSTSTRNSLSGTCRFFAPEIWDKHLYSDKSDVYALGCTLFELIEGQQPYLDRSNPMSICYACMYYGMPPLAAVCDDALNEFYYSCVSKCRDERCTVNELLQHRFLQTCTS